MSKIDVVSTMIEYENGELSDQKTLEFFAELVKTGMAFKLQGCYGRMAKYLIENEFINFKGEILKQADENVGE